MNAALTTQRGIAARRNERRLANGSFDVVALREGESTGGPKEGKQYELGQFLTPPHVAKFMASLFQVHRREWNLLDAGAGGGELSAAVVQRLCADRRRPKRIKVTAYEIDPTMVESLHNTY